MSRRGVCVVVFCLLLLGTGAALAAEGRAPVYQPGPIPASGKYIVTRNISGPIIIQAPDVDLDLNGFIVSGGAAAGPVIMIVPPADHVVVRNGTLASGNNCIGTLPGPGYRKVVIEDVLCRDVTSDGFAVATVESAVVRRTQVTNAAGWGINWTAMNTAVGEIEHNVIRRSGGGIYVLGASSLTIAHNTVESLTGVQPLGYGIFVDQSQGALVSENTIESASTDGIYFRTTYASKIFDNVVERSTNHGIHLNPASFNNLVLKNNSSNNGGAAGLPGCGLWVESTMNLIEGNILNGNSSYGLLFTGCGNGFGRNMARGNAGAMVICPGNPPLTPPESCNQTFNCAPYNNATSQQNLIPNLF
jgi:parallel beta-helix repeat protein